MALDDTLLGSARIRIRPDMDGFGRDVDNRVGAALKSAAKVAAGAFVVGMGAAVVGIKKAVDATSDLNESANAVRVTFGDAADGIAALGKSSAKALGLSTAEFNGLAVRFSNFAQTVAGDGGDVAKVMKELTGRAADFASVMNLDVADAATLFQSGLAGETEPLRKYGIDLSAAAVEAYALSQGINDGTHELTEQEKVLARYGLLMQSTAKTQGDFANTSTGVANQLRIAGAQFENLKAIAGEAFTPLIENALPKVNDGLTAVIDGLTANMPQIKQDMAEFGVQIGLATDRLVENWPEIQDQLEAVAAAVKDNWPEIVDTARTLGDAVERVGQMTQTLFNAFRALPPELQAFIATVALLQKTGVLTIGFKAADIVKDLFASTVPVMNTGTINAGVVNGGAAGLGGKAGAGSALATGAAKYGPAAAALVGIAGMAFVVDRSTESLAKSTTAANVYASAIEGARAKQSEVSRETERTRAAQVQAAQAAGQVVLPLVAQAQAAGQVAPAADAIRDALARAGVEAGATAEQSATMAAVFAGIKPETNIGAIPGLLMSAGTQAGLSAEQIGKIAPVLLATSGAAGVAAAAIGAIRPTATLTRGEIDAVSAAINALPVGANATLVAEAIQAAGAAAGMTQDEIDMMIGSINTIPAQGNVPALTSAIAVAGQAARLTDDQIGAMSDAARTVPTGATAEQLGEAIRIAGVKAGATDAQIEGVTAAAMAVPRDTLANVTTNAPAATAMVNELQRTINGLQGRTVDVGVKLSGSTGVGGGTPSVSTYTGGGMSPWMDKQVSSLAEALVPMLGAAGGYAGPGTGALGRPMSGYVVSSEFGPRNGTMHYGIDLAAPMGQGIFASAAGLVQQSGWNGGYGNFISIDHGMGLVTRYGHMSALLARAGQIVQQGSMIGQVGSTGDSTGPHLHFEVQAGGQFVNPRNMVAFDSGGFLQPGWSAVYNGTGRPEPVLTDKQWKQLSGGQTAGQGPVINIVNNYPQAEPTSVTTSRAMRMAATMGGM